MHRRSIVLALALVVLALPLSASQFIDMPFDQIAREATLVVRGTVIDSYSAWDESGEVIYTYATLRVDRYFADTAGPEVITIREVGGTVDGYTQEAIGFPMIRVGEEMVAFLAPWEDGVDFRIHAFNQGKYLIRNRGGIELLVADPEQQGDARLAPDSPERFQVRSDAAADEPGLRLGEFEAMVRDARVRGNGLPVLDRHE
jgi:hypothetical protein